MVFKLAPSSHPVFVLVYIFVAHVSLGALSWQCLVPGLVCRRPLFANTNLSAGSVFLAL